MLPISVSSFARLLCAASSLVVLVAPAARAQAPADSSSPARQHWRVSPSVRIGAEYDDNVFLLQPRRKDNVAAPNAADAASGRYAEMESANDVIASASARFDIKGPGFLTRSLTLSPSVAYEQYARNSERSHATLRMALEQNLPREGRLRLRGGITPTYFAKNYLADAVDRDGDRSIADDERMYAPGEYREGEVEIDYRHRLVKSTRQHPFGAFVALGAGYYDRAFETPHAGRDLSGPTAAARLRLELGRRARVEAGYQYAALDASPTEQVLLLDEAAFGRDFNANGTSTDLSVRATGVVDRSRVAHTGGVSLGLELSRRTDVELSYEHRQRDFSSTQPFDVAYRGRRDARNEFGADLSVRMARLFRLRMGGGYAVQRLSRDSEAGSVEDEDDYSKYRARVALTIGK